MKVEEVKLIYKSKVKADHRPIAMHPEQAYDIFIEHWDADQIELLEEVKALFLDRKCRVMSIASISKGGYDAALVDLRHVFAIAIKRRANGIILAHNHPSHELKPSQSDIQLTKQFIEAGKVLNIPIHDHIIVTPSTFSSVMDFIT